MTKSVSICRNIGLRHPKYLILPVSEKVLFELLTSISEILTFELVLIAMET